MAPNINKSLFEVGSQIIESSSIDKLNELRQSIFGTICAEFKIDEKDPEKGLNSFHKLVKNLDDTELNQKRVNVIQKISNDKKLVELIYGSFEKDIEELLGKDLLVQKTINLVIQTPNDLNPTIPHRDAPPNSYFELVIWIPLVNCKDTKSMYTVDLKSAKIALEELDKNPNDWQKFLNKIKDKKNFTNIKFGQALFFLPYVFHGSEINKTDETRFSLNIRFKALFTPSGKKFPLHFFRLFKISQLTKLALEKIKEEN